MKQITTIKTGIVFLAVFVLGSTWALACSNLGPGKHMGVVLRLDPAKGTMALMDAETRETLDFEIPESLLEKIHVDDRIVITFQKKKDHLLAKDVVVRTSKRGVTRGS